MLKGGGVERSGNWKSSLAVLENWPVLRAWMGRDAWAIGIGMMRLETRH